MSEGRADGLWAPQRRALTTGLVLTITFVASEALAVVTIMPVVARDLGGLRLYGWVFSGFMLGSVIGIVLAGREADRRGPAAPFVAGLLFWPPRWACWSRAGYCRAWGRARFPRWPMPRSGGACPARCGPG
jgi:MFS family permease